MRASPLRSKLPLAVLPLAALIAVLPMLGPGPSCGHDFDFHLLSWLEAASQLRHGFYPHWAYTPAFNAGEPRFLFYPPLSWLLGSLLGLLLPWAAVPIAFIWITLTVAGLTFYRLARACTSPAPALLAATLYLANPYMLFTAYERSAFAELLAAAWLPLLFAAALPIPHAPPLPGVHPLARQVARIAFPLALIWLTNAPAAVMDTYALAFIMLVRLIAAAPALRLRLALTACAGTLLGLALAAVYILPAARERRFVQISMVVMDGMRVNDHFLFHRMSGRSPDDLFHNAVVASASWIALALIAAAVALFPIAWRARRHRQSTGLTLLILALLTAGILFLLTPASLFAWHLLPQLQFLQFPWRLTGLLAAVVALTFALALPGVSPASRWARLTPLIALAAAALLALPAYRVFHQSCDAEDSVPARVALFHSNLGTEPTDEYTPVDADPDTLHPHDPGFWLLPAAGPQANVNGDPPPAAPPGQAPAHLQLSPAAPSILVLNRRAYPQWQIFSNHHLVTDELLPRDDGLIALPLAAGPVHIDLVWHSAPDQIAGEAVSGAALLLLAALAWRSRSHPA